MIREEKGIKGITLIALIITIIILLILASVSVATLVGENGIITKAREAKEKTERAEIIEKVKIDILEAQIGSNGDITNAQLQTILTKYFKDIPDTLPKDLTTLTLITKDEYGKYNIEISEIYDAEILLSAKDIADSEDKSAYYGSKVLGYNCEVRSINGEIKNYDGGWNLFFADENNIYLRAKRRLYYYEVPDGKLGSKVTPNPGYPTVFGVEEILADYDGLSDVSNSKVKALNSVTFASSSGFKGQSYNLAGYMLDTEAWSGFCGSKGEFAIGGASLEVLLRSVDQKYGTSYYDSCRFIDAGRS